VIEPLTQIDGTSVEVEFRSADSFSDDSGNKPFNATLLNAYGDYKIGTVAYHGDGSWSDDIRAANGGRFLQMRFSFFNNVDASLSPELDSVGVAFEE